MPEQRRRKPHSLPPFIKNLLRCIRKKSIISTCQRLHLAYLQLRKVLPGRFLETYSVNKLKLLIKSQMSNLLEEIESNDFKVKELC